MSAAQLDVLLWRLVEQATVFRIVHDDPRVAVVADGGVLFYSSAEAFTGSAKPRDTDEQVSTAVYDAAGRRLLVTAPSASPVPRRAPKRRRWAWPRARRQDAPVVLDPDELFPRDGAVAAQALREALRDRHRPEDLERMDLHALLGLETPTA